MKTIPELRRELEDEKLRETYREGKKEAKGLRKEIFKLKHHRLISAGKRIRRVGDTVGKNLKGMGEVAYKATKSQAHEISKLQKKKGYQSQHLLRNLKKARAARKRNLYYKGYSKSKRKRNKRRYSERSSYNPMNPFGLDF